MKWFEMSFRGHRCSPFESQILTPCLCCGNDGGEFGGIDICRCYCHHHGAAAAVGQGTPGQRGGATVAQQADVIMRQENNDGLVKSSQNEHQNVVPAMMVVANDWQEMQQQQQQHGGVAMMPGMMVAQPFEVNQHGGCAGISRMQRVSPLKRRTDFLDDSAMKRGRVSIDEHAGILLR